MACLRATPVSKRMKVLPGMSPVKTRDGLVPGGSKEMIEKVMGDKVPSKKSRVLVADRLLRLKEDDSA